MWEKLKMSLGKFVQGILNIFKKKNKTQETHTFSFISNGPISYSGELDNIQMGPGIITISPNQTELPVKLTYKDEFKRGKRAELNLFEDASDNDREELKKLLNAYLTDLPKRIHVPTLIISTYASWDYDSIGVDISQLEETGIAHYWCTSTQSMKEHMDDFRNRHPEVEEWDEDGESSSIIIPDAYLIEWPRGLWTWE